MRTPLPAPDPAAATDVPRARAKLPPPVPSDVQRERTWVRTNRRAEEAAPEHLDEDLFHPEDHAPPTRAEPTVEVEHPEERLLAQAEARVEDEPTDHGTGTPALPKAHPYADLSYEERMCRLMEDIAENTRLTSLRVGALEHKRMLEDASTLDLHPAPEVPSGWLETTRQCVVAWALDPDIKRSVVKVFVMCSTAGGSLGGSWATAALVFEFIERLLRAWVELP